MYTREVAEFLKSKKYTINFNEFKKIITETPQLVLVRFMPDCEGYHIILDNDIDEKQNNKEEITRQMKLRKEERKQRYESGNWDFSDLPSFDFKLIKTKH